MGLRARAKIHGLLRVANTLHFKVIGVATIRASHMLIVLAIENTGFCSNILVEIVIWVCGYAMFFFPRLVERKESHLLTKVGTRIFLFPAITKLLDWHFV